MILTRITRILPWSLSEGEGFVKLLLNNFKTNKKPKFHMEFGFVI